MYQTNFLKFIIWLAKYTMSARVGEAILAQTYKLCFA